jgi:hypothetical protein
MAFFFEWVGVLTCYLLASWLLSQAWKLMDGFHWCRHQWENVAQTAVNPERPDELYVSDVVRICAKCGKQVNISR